MKKYYLLFTMLILSVLQSASAKGNFEKGKDYQVTGPNVNSEPMVEEFFNYACSACYSIEGFMTEIKSDYPNLKVKPVPIELRPSWKIYVKAYFLGEKLGVLDQSHSQIFHRIHVEKKPFRGEKDMKEFFIALGVSEKKYDEVNNSFWLKNKVKQSKLYAQHHRVGVSPTLLVNQRYKLNNQNLGSYQRIKEAIKEFSGS
ncbi:thiol:disulfide interchange protein DsbA/DsbL [Aliikangiella coralliicola]|uniref:Thiol:disulfide interchange protein n=1 Tax=Aliikangiella coralliicola TaxID=2592383 RepID=A0A545UJ99_9GAMM|nr:thiol:disulfide interchange protein DsbA/DsbL [Aliikangiella coralliicola]TQV89513.1 thiol:disulfide interchange protein DsbA/DsbL [Aliikangiella coralliicola]